MIKSFRHKGLKRFFEAGTSSGIQPAHKVRLSLILGRLNVSVKPDDIALPGLKFHPLHAKGKRRYAVSVSGNWRVTFGFENGHAVDVDYEDYH